MHPKLERRSDPIYADAYMDGDFDGIDAAGTVGVPEGPGLGVRYDWEFIAKHTVASKRYC